MNIPASKRVFDIFTIPVSVNVTLLVLLGFLVFFMGWWAIPFSLILFVSVLAHELGHALAAKQYGIECAGINLNLLGGVAMFTSMPDTPKRELWVAAAGPMVSFVLAGIGCSMMVGSTFLPEAVPFRPYINQFFSDIFVLNMMVGFFNMLPAYPMDGGRILKALLSMRMPQVRAVRITTRFAYVFGVLFIGGGMYIGHLFLPLIGALVIYFSYMDERNAMINWMLNDYPKRYH